jgi:predicted transcriptional regulator
MANAIPALDQNWGDAEPLKPRIMTTTTIRAAPAVHIIMEKRIDALRSRSARSSYLFISPTISGYLNRTQPAAGIIEDGKDQFILL